MMKWEKKDTETKFLGVQHLNCWLGCNDERENVIDRYSETNYPYTEFGEKH